VLTFQKNSVSKRLRNISKTKKEIFHSQYCKTQFPKYAHIFLFSIICYTYCVVQVLDLYKRCIPLQASNEVKNFHRSHMIRRNVRIVNSSSGYKMSRVSFSSSSFPLGSFRKHLSLTAYCTIPRIGHSNFLHKFRAAPPPKQRKLEL
jgi:hypothetical protein